MVAELADIATSRELERAKRFEHASVVRIFDRHYDAVHGFIFALTSDAATAEELASLVFLRLLDALEGITGQGAGLEGWLYTTALALVQGRRRRPLPQRAAGLLELPADEREALALRLLAGLDVERIAAATGRTPGAVLATQARALRRLAGPPRSRA